MRVFEANIQQAYKQKNLTLKCCLKEHTTTVRNIIKLVDATHTTVALYINYDLLRSRLFILSFSPWQLLNFCAKAHVVLTQRKLSNFYIVIDINCSYASIRFCSSLNHTCKKLSSPSQS